MENKRTRGNFNVMCRLVGLVKPLAPVMVCAVLLGVAGFLCAIFIPVLGVYALLDTLLAAAPIALGTVCILLPILAVARGVLHYAEQGCNHFIAFKLLALIRDKVFGVLRQLAPAKLEGRDKGDLIAVLTADIELLEVFYAHTISPICDRVRVKNLQQLNVSGQHGDQVALVAALQLGGGQLAQHAKDLVPDERQQLERNKMVAALLRVVEHAAGHGQNRQQNTGGFENNGH